MRPKRGTSELEVASEDASYVLFCFAGLSLQISGAFFVDVNSRLDFCVGQHGVQLNEFPIFDRQE